MKTTEKNIQKFIDSINTNLGESIDLKTAFDDIIKYQTQGYDSEAKKALKSFLTDMQKGGCISGMIGDFIYHKDCRDFYIKHIDELEEYRTELEEQLGEPVKNKNSLPHYTFVCWLCFEEYCYEIYRELFDN